MAGPPHRRCKVINFERLLLMRTAARVERCHTTTTIHRQTDGEHTFGVLAILLTICPEASADLIKACLFHDVPEAITGDIPSPIMHKYRELRAMMNQIEADILDQYELRIDISVMEQRILKYCDRMELWMFALEEIDTGNRRMYRVASRVRESIAKDKLYQVTPQASELFDYVAKRHLDICISSTAFPPFHTSPDI